MKVGSDPMLLIPHSPFLLGRVGERGKCVEAGGGRDPGQRPNQAALVRPSTREGLAAALALKSVPVQAAALLRTTTGEKSGENARNRLRMWFKDALASRKAQVACGE